MTARKRLDAIIDLIGRYGGIDGAHHKAWVLDQVMRIALSARGYAAWRKQAAADGYDWDEGIAP